MKEIPIGRKKFYAVMVCVPLVVLVYGFFTIKSELDARGIAMSEHVKYMLRADTDENAYRALIEDGEKLTRDGVEGNDALGHLLMAMGYINLNDVANAEAQVNVARTCSEFTKSSYVTKVARAYAEHGHYPQCVTLYESLLKDSPSSWVQCSYGLFLVQTKNDAYRDTIRGEQMIRSVFWDPPPTRGDLIDFSEVVATNGKWAEALELLDKAEKLPESPGRAGESERGTLKRLRENYKAQKAPSCSSAF